VTTRIDDLPGVLARHREWVRSGGGKGERANLAGANLAGANLAGANLTRAKGIAWAGPVGSEGRTVYAVDHGETVMVQAGCWWGSVDELRARIAPGGEHGWSPDDEARHRGQYEAASAWLLGALGKDGGS
jgi:hypothetical protein